METAVRNHLGFARAGELEGRFRAMIRDVRDVAAGRQPSPSPRSGRDSSCSGSCGPPTT